MIAIFVANFVEKNLHVRGDFEIQNGVRVLEKQINNQIDYSNKENFN